jgi:glycosyltransferase involved in cell wall biosynthesis
VALVQPALPSYRIPLFRALAAHPDIALSVFYGAEVDLPNVSPEGFNADYAPQQALAGNRLFWHGAQLDQALTGEFDVLICNWNTRYLSLVPALLAARRRQLGTVLWGHGYSLNEGTMRRKLRDQVGRLSHANLFYDERTARAFIRRGWDERRLFVAPNAIEHSAIHAATQYWQTRLSALRAFATAQNINPNKLLLLVARSPLRRRVDILLEALGLLNDTDVTLVVIGGAPERELLRPLCEQLKITRQVRLLEPAYDEMQLAPWFLNARLMCFPERVGLSLHHAFAYGVPVVVGDCRDAHNPEIEAVEDSVNALTFAHNQPSALADVLRRLLADDALQRKLALGALATAARYGVPATVNGIVNAVRYAGSVCHRR